MKAVGFTRHLPVSDEQCLQDLELPEPSPGPHDLLVRVAAVSVNPVDTKQRAPRERLGQPTASPRVLGWDAAGTVVGVGEAVTLFEPGDRVYYAGSLERPGCNSELHLVEASIAGPMPASLSFAQAAALPLTALTAWEALFERLRVSAPGRPGAPGTILIVGGAGGVGSIAIQLASRVAGLHVIATASRPESREWCMALGAQLVVDHSADIAAQVRAAGHRWVDHVLVLNALDMHFAAACEIVAPQGGVCSIVANESPLDPAAMALLRRKSGCLSWEMMFTRSGYATADRIEQHHILLRIAALVDRGVLRSTATAEPRELDAANLRQAHAALESGRAIGKLVLAFR